MKSPTFEVGKEEEKIERLTELVRDREDFPALLPIMRKQGATGILQPSDYDDALKYREQLPKFLTSESLEGSAVEIFDEIIFDFDGVLYDGMYAVNRAVLGMIETMADKTIPLPKTIEDIATSFQSPFQKYYRRFGIFLETPEEITSFRDAYREVQTKVNAEHHTPATLFPEVKAVLDAMKAAKRVNPNLKIHIISAGSAKHIQEVLTQHGVIGDFDQIHAECHDKVAMIQFIAERAPKKERVVMVGDLPSDIKDGQKVNGVRTLAVARTPESREWLGMYLPDYIVSDLSGMFHLQSYAKELQNQLQP